MVSFWSSVLECLHQGTKEYECSTVLCSPCWLHSVTALCVFLVIWTKSTLYLKSKTGCEIRRHRPAADSLSYILKSNRRIMYVFLALLLQAVYHAFISAVLSIEMCSSPCVSVQPSVYWFNHWNYVDCFDNFTRIGSLNQRHGNTYCKY